jgi:hypothetical protein
VVSHDFHTCAITTSDRGCCWGNDFQGQLGIGTVDGNPFTIHSAPEAVVGPG